MRTIFYYELSEIILNILKELDINLFENKSYSHSVNFVLNKLGLDSNTNANYDLKMTNEYIRNNNINEKIFDIIIKEHRRRELTRFAKIKDKLIIELPIKSRIYHHSSTLTKLSKL